MGLPSVIGGPDPYRDYDGPVCPECGAPTDDEEHTSWCSLRPIACECGRTYTAESREAFKERDGMQLGPCCQEVEDVYPDGWPHPDNYREIF